MITASTLPNLETSAENKQAPQEIRVRVLRQDAPGDESYWQQFAIPYEPNMNINVNANININDHENPSFT